MDENYVDEIFGLFFETRIDCGNMESVMFDEELKVEATTVATSCNNPGKKSMQKLIKVKWDLGHGTCIPSWMLHKKFLVGVNFGLLMVMEIGKGNGKGFGKAWDIYWHFIYENNGKPEKTEVKGHRLHVRSKMKENKGKVNKLES